MVPAPAPPPFSQAPPPPMPYQTFGPGTPPGGGQSTGPRSGPPPWVWLVALAGIAGVVALVVVLSSGSTKHTMTGSITVYDSEAYGCDLSAGYSDIDEGTRV